MSTHSCNTSVALRTLWQLCLLVPEVGCPRSPAGLPSVRRSFSVSDGACHCDRPPTLPSRPGNPRGSSQVNLEATGLWQWNLGSWFGVCSAWHELCVLEDVSTGKSKFINKELAVLLFTNTTSQMTSLMVSWLLVIFNHWKNFERISCTGFRTKFLSTLKSLGANTVMLITLKYCKILTC